MNPNDPAGQLPYLPRAPQIPQGPAPHPPPPYQQPYQPPYALPPRVPGPPSAPPRPPSSTPLFLAAGAGGLTAFAFLAMPFLTDGLFALSGPQTIEFAHSLA